MKYSLPADGFRLAYDRVGSGSPAIKKRLGGQRI
jgi:hypothetical protein